MQTVDDQPETIHLYVVREKEKKPFTFLPLLGAFLCLVGITALTFYSAQHPYYEHERLSVPAISLPPKVFTASAAIIPTGVKLVPASYAVGVLTITNGSIIGQSIPAGFTIQGVVTDRGAYVPGGSANGYGWAQVSAHALLSGRGGNLPAYAINSVIGSSVYVRNLSAFSGGRDSYSVKFVTNQDKQTAEITARNLLALQSVGLHYPCTENHIADARNMVVTWHCQFVTYTIPSYMRVLRVRLSGKNLLVDVVFTPPPVRVWEK